MNTILDMTKVFLSSVCFLLFPTDVACNNIFFFCSCRVITLAYRFGKMVPVTAVMDAIFLRFSSMDNALLCASGLPPEDKTEERITFGLSHAPAPIQMDLQPHNGRGSPKTPRSQPPPLPTYLLP